MTLIILIWIIIATYITPRAHNYWALFVMELVFLGLWDCGFPCAMSIGFNTIDTYRIVHNHSAERGTSIVGTTQINLSTTPHPIADSPSSAP